MVSITICRCHYCRRKAVRFCAAIEIEEQQTQHHDPKLANRALSSCWQASRVFYIITATASAQDTGPAFRLIGPESGFSAFARQRRKKLPVRHGATMIRTAISICTSHATTTLICYSTTTATAFSRSPLWQSVALPNAASAGASWADYDNDGWPDL